MISCCSRSPILLNPNQQRFRSPSERAHSCSHTHTHSITRGHVRTTGIKAWRAPIRNTHAAQVCTQTRMQFGIGGVRYGTMNCSMIFRHVHVSMHTPAHWQQVCSLAVLSASRYRALLWVLADDDVKGYHCRVFVRFNLSATHVASATRF